MESSEEEDIINNDEDDYGEFSQANVSYKKNIEGNKNIKNLKFSNNNNLITEKDELLINNDIQKVEKIDEQIINDKVKDKAKLEKLKRNNLMIVNKVIDLNINQNRKKRFEEINELKNKQNDNNIDIEENESENESENDGEEQEEIEDENNNEENEQNEKIFDDEKDKKDEKMIEGKQKEIETFSPEKNNQIEINKENEDEALENKKEEIIDKINIENQNENNLNNNQEDGKEEENEEDEEEEEWETIKNKLIKEETKKEENNQNIKENKENENKEINSPEKEKENIDLNVQGKKGENNGIKKKELSNTKNQTEIIIFKEEEKIKSKNKTNSEYKKQESYEKDKDESIIIKEKIDLDKNFIMQSKDKEKNQLDNEEYFQDFNKEKNVETEKLKEKEKKDNKNVTKLGNEIQTIIKKIPNDLNEKNRDDINDINYKFEEPEKNRKANQRKQLNKNKHLQNLNISTNFSYNKKESFFSTNSFNSLLGNKTFRKFLNNKLEQNKNIEDEVPRKFIENLPIRTEKQNIIKDKNQNKINETITTVNYSIFYNEDNYQIPLFHKTYRRTVNDPYNPFKSNNIQKNFNNRYSNDISLPQYDDNSNEEINKMGTHRFTTSGYTHFNDNISELNLKNQKLHDKILELENEIRISKNEMNKKNSELEKYFSSYDKMTLENNLNKEKIDELKREIKLQRGEMNEKQNKISELENMNTNLKNEMTKLQKNYDAESTMNKETKQNYDLIKSNYNDIKNQFDLLNIKYQTLTDENFNFKRDKALYERQIKTKNQMIESLIENKSNILNNKLYKLDLIEEKEESNHEMFLDYLKNKNIPNEIPKKEDKDNGMKKPKEDKNQNGDEKKDIDYSKFDKLTYPELQSKRDELVNERKNLNNIFSKIPLKSNYKGQLEKRNELERQLNEINCDLAVIKLRMKKLKN